MNMHKIQRIVVILVTLFMVTASRAGKLLPIVVTGNGTVTASKSNGDPIAANSDVDGGTTVKLTVAPGSGSYLYKLIAKEYAPGPSAGAPSHRADGPTVNSEIPMTKISATLYQFIMPTYDVEVTAEFVTGTSIADATINLNEVSHVYDWIEHSPTVTSVTLGSITLTEGTDYTVDVFVPVKNVGNYNVTVRGKGKYYGSATHTYSITARSLAGTTDYLAANVQLPQTSFVYNHSEQKPVLTSVVVYNNGQELVLDRDYENVRYETSTSMDVGSYRVLVTGKGNFKDDASASYTITKMPISNCTINGTTSFVFNNSVQAPTVNVTGGASTGIIITDGVAQLATTDYTVTYNNGGSTWSPTASSTQIGTYHMRLKATESSNYSGYVDIPYYITSAGATITAVGGTTYTGDNIYATAYTGQEITPTITVMDGSATLTRNTHYTVQYYNNVNAGLATVTAVGMGAYNFSVSRNFRINPKTLTDGMVTLSATSFTYNANVQKPTVTVSDGTAMKSSDYVITNEGGTNVGTDAYTVSVQGQNNYTGTINKTFSITALTYNDNNTTITLSTTDYVYDGTAKTPTVQQVKIGGIVIPSTDYTAVPSNNTDAGTATVTIEPRNIATSGELFNLSGSASTTFTIAPRPISDMTISLDETSFTYNGLVQTPTVSITGLTLGTDYTLSYSSHDTDGNPTSTDVGTYTVTITGQGNYTGSINKTYVINQSSSDNTFDVKVTGSYTYKGSAYTPEGTTNTAETGQAVLVRKKVGTNEADWITLTPGTDYSLSYRDNTDAGSAKVTATGKGNYQFVQTGTFTIQPKVITDGMATLSGAGFVSSGHSFVYNGALQKPIVTITDAALNKTLVEGTDYTLVNAGGTIFGDYNATITGRGNYITGEGGLVKNYSITKLSLTDAVVTLDPLQSYVYDGTEKRPGVQQVKVGNVIVPAADYEVTYPTDATPTTDDNDNVNAGVNTAKVYIKPATTNLSDSKTQNFSITKKPLTSEMITLSSSASDWNSNSFVYNGSQRTPTVTVSDIPTGFTTSIIQASDYTITNAGGTAVGVYYVTVAATADGNYSGTIKVPYSIVSDNSETDVTITLGAGDNLTYTGNPITRTITVNKGTSTTPLTVETDYEVVYNNNINVGEATITILGKGNYHFVKYAKFNIAARTLEAQSTTVTDNYTTITISANSFEYNGSVQKPNVTVKYTYTKTGETTPTTITLKEGTDYTLSNPGAINVGTGYKAVVTGIGNFTGSMDSENYSITALSFDKNNTTFTLSNTSYVYDGTAKTPGVVQVKIGDVVIPSTDYTPEYSDNTNAGTNTAKVTIRKSSSGNLSESDTEADRPTATFTINRKSIANVEITLDPSSFTFKNGVTQKPTTVTVIDKERGTSGVTLTSGADYTLTNDGGIAAGVYDVTVTGAGNYTGTAKKSYVINETAGSTAITIANIADQTFTGAAITPTPTITYSYDATNTVTLNKDEHYTLSYINNTNVGEATVIVTLKGGYTGSATKTFNIVAKSLAGATVTPNTSFIYNGNVQKPSFVVVVDSRTLDAGVDYNVTYNGDAISAGTQNVTINGIGNYTGTQAGSYTINTLSLSTATIKLPSETFVYNRGVQKPTPVVSVGSLVISANDYDVSWDDDNNPATTTPNFENVGTKYITVTGKNNCQGSKGTTYVITAKQLDANMVTLAQTEMTYTGSALNPGVTVTDGETQLVEGTDTNPQEYKLEITNNVNVGTATVKVTGQGNYTGVVQKTFNIQTQAQQDFTISDIAAVTYNGSEYRPTPTVKYGTVDLVNEKDYTLSYRNNVYAGTATVIVTGKGGYEGSSGTKNFTINPKQLDPTKVSLSYSSVNYTGAEQKPAVTVLDGDNPLSENRDYTIVYSNNINAGTATVTVTGCGNYSTSTQATGTIVKQFTINKLSIASGEVNLSYISTVFNGSVQKPTVQTVYANGHKLTATTDYTVTMPVDADAINQGAKTVTVTGTGNYTGSKSATYTIAQKEVSSSMIKIANENLTYTGSAQTAVVTIEDLVGSTNIITSNDYTLTNPGGTEVGNYTVTIDGKGNYKGSASKQYSIVTAGSTGFTVDPIAAQNYTGLPLTPEVTVKKAGTDGGLTVDTDYTLDWANNINAGANTASVTVTGKGNYSGTQTVYFTITPKSLNATGITATLSPTSFTYTGSTQKPTVTVKDGTAKTLAENTDYMLVNDGGVANGTYTVTITGMGNYKDVITPAPSYTIGGQNLNGAEVILNRLDSYVYDGNEKKPGVSEVKVGSTVIPASNYTVSYADNVNAGTATVTVTGKGNCSGTATATFPITPKTVNSDMITITPTTFNYDGQLHKPTTVTVKDGTRDMVEDTDYTLSNPGGTDIGSYGVTITGKGNYTGTASKSFSIVANDASGFSINAIADVTYNGAAQEPVPVVKEGDNTLSSNYYSVAYLNNINAGTAVVTVTGKNGYTFVKSQTFKIKPKALNNDMLTLSASSFMYNGNVQKPTPTMDDKNAGVSIITSNDYVVTNEGGVDVGTYHVVITGQNNYTGAIDKTFTITQLSLSTATITLATLSSYVYDGAAKTPAVQLVKVGELVVPATAYDVAYSSNTNVGTATVTVTAKTGTNFKDGNTTTFSIEQKPVTSDMIYLSSENLEYTGSNIKPEVTVKDGTKTLALTTDYTLTNAGGTEVGSYEVMITGQGNYKGTAKKQYSIITKGAAGFTVDELTVPLTYTGMPLTPTVTVKKAGITTILTLGTDYEVAYTDNINVGTATATVTGKGNYSGTRSVNFTINPKPLTDGMVALSSTSFTYNGSEQKPVVSVTDTDNNLPLIQGTHYTVTYPTDAISQGTKTVTIRGIGNYTGVITKDYSIGMLSLNNASVTLNELTSYIYDGTEKKPTVREVLVGTLVVPTIGYTVAYPEDVINTGTKTITITGKGDYTGAATASYTITPKTVNKEMILLSSENLIYTGSIIKPTVTVKDGSKTLIENTDYTLTNDGGKEVGTYSLTITGKGNYTGTASRTFNIITKGASVFSVSDIASVIYNGSEQEPDITVMDNSTSPATVLTEGTHYTVAYSNNKNVGSASVIVTGIGSYAGTVSKNFTIMPKTLTGAMVILSTTSFVFNSLAQKPEVTVDDKNAANVSIITDYDYTILNNGGINVGDNHEVKVTGKGNYTGTVTKTYAITPLSIADANVTLYQLQSYVYDGTAKKPGVREVMVGDITVPTTGYDVSYGENTNVGTATVTLTGKGNFKDAKTVNFTITGKPITSDMIVLSSENFIYNGEVQKPTVIVKDGAKTLTLGTDYALTNAGGTSVGTYSVTVAGMGNYASEASRSYSIVEKDGTTNFTISLSNTSVQYNGSAQTPAVTVTDGVKTLTNNTDYEVAYTNHVNVGTATVTVTGKGNYAGTKTATFTITAKPLTEAMVTLSETSFVYNTLIQKPEVSVSDGDIMTKDDYVITNNGGTNQGTYHVIVNGQGNYSGQIDKTFTITPLSIADANVTLYQLQSYVYEGLQKKPGVREVTVGNINVPTQGYTTSYGDNVNAGTASVTVTGQGNFKDSKTVTFEIEPKAVENSMITLSNYEYTYNGEIQKPEVIVRDGETTLVLETDYTLQNNGGKTVGAYDVTITGKGNYKGTASKTYIINAKEVGSFEVTLSAESVIYNGSEQQPEVTVKDGETVLTPGVNYTVAYTDNVNVGMATVTVRGLGEYDGSRDKTFLIKPKELSNAMVSLSSTTFTYNGLLQMPAVTVSDGTALTSNDYYITNEGGLDKGTYNVMVTGRNNYTGTVVRQYAINPMSINDAHVTLYQLQSYVYDGTEKNPGVREIAVGSHIVPSTSFTTTISPNINVGTVTVTVTGEKNYTGSASTTFEITPKPVTSGMITLTPDYFYYNGSVQKPAVIVKDGSKNMVENTDYTVTNEGGMEAGDYEVKVKGIGNYMDEASVKFTILSSGVNTFVVTLETTEYTFDGTERKPNVTVKMEDRTLSEGTDYTLLYNNNVNAGTATVTVKGVGDYTGEQMKTFVILPKTLTDEMVTLDKTSFI